MAKRPVTMSLREDDLKALDEFAAARRLTRGDAVGVLLEAYSRAASDGGRLAAEVLGAELDAPY